MPHLCCVPFCKGIYPDGPKVSCFSFSRDPQEQAKWIRTINRGNNFKSTKASRVCELYFQSHEIERQTSYYVEKTGELLTAALKIPRHAKGAIPSKIPSQLSGSLEDLSKASRSCQFRTGSKKGTTKPDASKKKNAIKAIETPISVDTADEKDISYSEENEDSNSQPLEEPSEELVRCRTCLELTNKASCLQLISNLPSIEELRNMLKYLVGPMDLDTPVKPFMCFKCEKILRLSHSFKMQCVLIEESLKKLQSIKSRELRLAGAESKRTLASSVKSSKRQRDNERVTILSRKKIKRTTDDEDQEVDMEVDTILKLKDIEKDIRTKIDVDNDIVGLIENEVNNSEETNVKKLLSSKFKSDPGVKIVPYIIPRQVICITPTMFKELENNSRINSQQIETGKKSDEKERSDSVQDESLELTTASLKSKQVSTETISVESTVEQGNETLLQRKSVEENAVSKIADDDHETIIIKVGTSDNKDNQVDETAHLDVNPLSESEEEEGETDDYFENFEPDWFKASEKKRRSRNIKCKY